MSVGRAFRQQQAARSLPMERIRASTPPHYFSAAYPETSRPPYPGDTGRDVATALLNVMTVSGELLAGVKAHEAPPPWTRFGDPNGGYRQWAVHLFPHGAATAFAELDVAIHVALHSWMHDGFFRGTRLVRQLSSGDVGLAEFNKQTERFR